jgi:DNA-binding NarL/FixJ family response regulator
MYSTLPSPTDPMAEAAGVGASCVCGVVGPAGLALDVFGRLLQTHGVAVADLDSSAVEELDVLMLVEPRREHWDTARSLNLPVVAVLREPPNDDEVVEAVLAGADAVVHADTAPEAVVRALQEVSHGGSILTAGQARIMAQLARSSARPKVVLSRRETEIVASIAGGMGVKQTARQLGISAKTVENLQGRLFRKLGVRNRAQAVVRAHGLGLV